MSTESAGTGQTSGVGELGWSWLIYLAILPPALITYARLPPLATYHFNATGLVGGGLSRTVTELNYPVAMAAIPLAAIGVRAASSYDPADARDHHHY
jgi:hypothetical protein